MKDKQEIQKLIEELNESWMSGDFERIGELLDEEVIFVIPDFSQDIEGKPDCVETYKQFHKTANTIYFRSESEKVWVWDDFAVAHQEYEIKYEIDGELVKEKGTEILNFKKTRGEWKIIWRSMGNNKKIN